MVYSEIILVIRLYTQGEAVVNRTAFNVGHLIPGDGKLLTQFFDDLP